MAMHGAYFLWLFDGILKPSRIRGIMHHTITMHRGIAAASLPES